MSEGISFNYSKAALLDALEARRPYLKKRDQAETAKHRADEKAALAAFKEKCRAAIKWDYETAKKKAGRYSYELILERTDCPTLCIPRLDRAVEQIKRDGRIRYAITPNGQFSTIHFLLACDDRKPETC